MRVAAPAVTDHVTGAWLDGSPPRSVTSATNADVASTPGLTFWLLPAMIFMIAGGPELTVNAVPPKFTKLPPTTIAYAPEPSCHCVSRWRLSLDWHNAAKSRFRSTGVQTG